jgi:hypothetical protein
MNFAATRRTLLLSTGACSQIDSDSGKVAERVVIWSFETVSYSGAKMPASWSDMQLTTT